MSMRYGSSKKKSSTQTSNPRMKFDEPIRESNAAEETKELLRENQQRTLLEKGLYSRSQNAELAKYLADNDYNRHLAKGRTLYPQVGALTESEFSALRRLQSAYDDPNVDVGYIPESTIRTLQGFGFVNVKKGGRVVPGFITFESGEDSTHGYIIHNS